MSDKADIIQREIFRRQHEGILPNGSGFYMGVVNAARPVLLDSEVGWDADGLRRHHLPRLLLPANSPSSPMTRRGAFSTTPKPRNREAMGIETMKRTIILLLSFAAFQAYAHPAENVASSAAVPTPSAECEAIAGTRMRVDWQRLISGHNLELPRLPGNHTDSLRLGNGDIGVAVYAVPECLVLFVGKNDLLDYRTKPLAHSPEATALTNAATPMPTTKPAGWIRFRNATPRNPDAKARLDIWNAEVSTSPPTDKRRNCERLSPRTGI